MTTVQLAIFVPLVAGLLSFGLGALVSHLASGGSDAETRIPRLLWPVLGFAAIIVLTNGVSHLGIVLPFNAIIVVGLGLAGLFLERRALLPSFKQAGLAVITAGPVLVAFSGAILLAGPTITGYLLDSNTGVHSLGADYLLHHGGDFASIPRTSTDAAMVTRFFVDSTYPSGAHALYGLLGSLTGSSLTFVSTPLMGACLAVAALSTAAAARALKVPPLIAAITGFLVSCGALTFAFALSSELKEVVTLPLLAGMTAFALDGRAARTPRQALVVVALLGAAMYSVIGLSCAAWVGPFAILMVARLHLFGPERSIKGAAKTLGLLVALGLLLIAPLLPGLADQLQLARALSETNASLAADPGNLIGPIHKTQALGIWIGPDHRGAAEDVIYTYGLIAIAWLLVGAGVYGLLRQRQWWPAIWLGVLVALWYLLTARGTLWLDSKLVMLSGITLMLLVAVGVTTLAADRRKQGVSVLLAVGLIGPVVAGVILSDYALYESTTTASNERFEELAAIDEKYAGKGPAYFTEFDEYAMYTMRNMHFVGSGYADNIPHPVVKGDPGVPYGSSTDSDRITTAELQRYPLLVSLRSPQRSAPGSDWDLADQGRFFDVWKRVPARSAKIVRHIPVGQGQAFDKPKCSAVTAAAALARRENATLVARVAAGPSYTVSLDPATMTPNWAASYAATLGIRRDGRIVQRVPRAARTREQAMYVVGAVGRPLAVKTEDGRLLGTFERLAAGDGSVSGPVMIPAGQRNLLIESTKRQLRPGTNSPTVARNFIFAPPQEPTLKTVAPADARSLCSETLDWIDVVAK